MGEGLKRAVKAAKATRKRREKTTEDVIGDLRKKATKALFTEQNPRKAAALLYLADMLSAGVVKHPAPTPPSTDNGEA